MNNYWLAMVLVASLAAGANAGLPVPITRQDVTSLDQYLEDNAPYGEMKSDLALIEQEVGSLQGGAKRAAEAILALRDIKECNKDVLAFFVHVVESGLNKIGNRAREVSRPLASKAGYLCNEYIQQFVLDRYRLLASDGSVEKLFQVLRRRHEMFELNMSTPKSMMIENFLRPNILKELVGKESLPLAGNRANFDRLFEANIGEPCKMLTYMLKDGYKKTWLVAEVSSVWFKFIKQTSVPFKNIIWAYDSCEALLSMNDEEKSLVFQSM